MNPVTAAGDWVTRRSIRSTECLVKEPKLFVRMVIRDFMLVVTAIAFGLLTSPDSWWETIAKLLLGIAISCYMLSNIRRAVAYRSGWMDGRHELVSSMNEAHARGMGPEEWLEAEFLRNLSVLGIAPEEAAAALHRFRRMDEG